MISNSNNNATIMSTMFHHEHSYRESLHDSSVECRLSTIRPPTLWPSQPTWAVSLLVKADIVHIHCCHLLPHDALLARFMLWPCVCMTRQYCTKIAKRYTILWSFVHLSVYLSVCPSQAGIVLKLLNMGSWKECHTITQGHQFSDARDLGKFSMRLPQ